MTAPDFGSRAATYDELRPTDENWWEVFETLVREGDLTGRRVLDVGCGTGRFAATLASTARVWGVDQSPQMLDVARARAPGVRFKEASAEFLPFKDGWFERATMWLVLHLLDRPSAFAELRRVLAPEGRLAVATFDPSYFGLFWFRDYFPSMEEIDRARFPTRADFEAELPAAGFEAPRFTRLRQRAAVTREVALERIRGRHIATFDLISEDEFHAGLERAERELPERVEYRQEWLLAVAEVAGQVEEVAAAPVEREEIEVMFLRIRDDVQEMKVAWERLEGLVGTHGRKFYGAFDPSTKEYRVCVQIQDDDDPSALGLETGTLPGGRYLRARLRGDPPEVYERIAPTFDALARSATPDETRPSLEFYRRRDEIDLLLPVADQ